MAIKKPLVLYGGQVKELATGDSLPALTIFGDTNTGIYFPAANTLGIATNGAERFTFGPSGNVSFTNNSNTQATTLSGTNAAAGGTVAQLIFSQGADSIASIHGVNAGSMDSGHLTFLTQPAGGTNTERVRLTSAGELLVGGTGTTGEKVQIYGDAKIVGSGVFGASRKVNLALTNGVVTIKNVTSDAAWSNKFAFESASNTTLLGGLSAYGTTKDTISYLTLGQDYTDTKFRLMMDTGNVLIGTSTDPGYGAKVHSTAGISLGNSAVADGRVLDWYEEGTYTATATGMTTAPTGTVKYTRVGNQVTLDLPTISGTSNATTFTLTGGPTQIRPAGAKTFVVLVADNSGAAVYGKGTMGTDGTLALYKGPNGDGFTASGTKTVWAFSVSYTLQ